MHGGGSFVVVRWAPLLTSANVRPSWKIVDRVRDQKTIVAWWRSRGGYLACSGLRQPALHGSDWSVQDIVGDDDAREVGCVSASSWVVVAWRGDFLWRRV